MQSSSRNPQPSAITVSPFEESRSQPSGQGAWNDPRVLGEKDLPRLNRAALEYIARRALEEMERKGW